MTNQSQIIADMIDAVPVLQTNSQQTLIAPEMHIKATPRPCVKECSALDHSDTDNGKRLRTYFADDILVMLENGMSGGSFLVWTGQFWDLIGGAAAAALLAQRVGDLIMEEADYLANTPYELDAIKDAASAKKRRDALDLVPEGERDDAQKAEHCALADRIDAGDRARAALNARKRARRKFGVSSKNNARLTAMQNCAAPHLRRHPDTFNANDYAIAVDNCTLHFVQVPDLECPDPDVERMKWKLEARLGHDRADLITALVPVDYDADALAPAWSAFLDRFMPMATQSDKRRTLAQYCGLGLLGVLVQFVMYHQGLGANGKSVFQESLMRLLGPNFAVSLPSETLIGKSERGAGQASPDIMRLFGKRMLRVSEVPANKPLQESLIKHITGGEKMTARTLFKGYVDFTNKAKPHMSGNGFPIIDGTDNGIWRRILVMHWTETIAVPDQKDFEIVVCGLLAEAPGILNWLIDGALDYLNNGFYIAPAVREATQDYRDEMDTVGQFVRDCVTVVEGESITAREFYNAYFDWATANAKRPVFETKFGRVMKTKFKRTDKAVRTYEDISLHDVPPRASKTEAPPDGTRDFP